MGPGAYASQALLDRRYLALDEAQDVLVNRVRMSCRHAMREAWVNFQGAMLEQLRLQQ